MQRGETPKWGQTASQRIFIAAIVLGISLPLAGLFLYQAHAESSVQQSTGTRDTSSGAMHPSAKIGVAPDLSTPQKAPMLEVHIANNGLTLLRGARVISTSGDRIRVITAWDSADFTWEVHTNFFTKFITAEGGKETFRDIQLNDVVTITGTLVQGGTGPIIDADFLRE